MTHSLDRLDNAKVLIYSHDSFGLGHLRRCRAIAHSLVDTYKGLSVLILSGSPIISRFDFKARVDFIRIPGVVKLYSGDYTSLGLHIELDQTLAIRASIIQHTAQIYNPDIFLVDKEPLGLRGEVEATLKILKQRNTKNVLGLRDVMDDSEALQVEWQRKKVVPALDALYDEIWVYGDESIVNPIQGIEISGSIRNKMHYLGYLKRQLPAKPNTYREHRPQPYILITAGGGGDGEDLIDWVVRAYETNGAQLMDGIVVLGPFMAQSAQDNFMIRIQKIPKLSVKTFDSYMELLMDKAQGVIAMGGYNTFCEILSFDKRAVLVPRETPRLEQHIRAEFAQQRGLVTMINYSDINNTSMMVNALKRLPEQLLPSSVGAADLLNGLNEINRRVEQLIKDE